MLINKGFIHTDKNGNQHICQENGCCVTVELPRGFYSPTLKNTIYEVARAACVHTLHYDECKVGKDLNYDIYIVETETSFCFVKYVGQNKYKVALNEFGFFFSKWEEYQMDFEVWENHVFFCWLDKNGNKLSTCYYANFS